MNINTDGTRWIRYIALIATMIIINLMLSSNQVNATDMDWDATWQAVITANGSKTEARHEASGVLIDDTFYLIGGRGTRSTDAYNITTNRWASHAAPPLQIHHFQAAVYDGDIWIVSAMYGNYPSEDPIPNILIFDTDTKTWSTGPSIPSGRNRGSSGVITYNDEMYVVSGTTNGHSGGFKNWVDKYDPATNRWTQLANIPTARDHYTAEVINGKIVVAGGRQTNIRNTSTWHNTVKAVNVYDIATNSWEIGDDLQAEGAGTMSAVCGDHVIVLGGETTASSAKNTVSAFDIDTYRWQSLPAMINGRHGGGAFISDNVLHAVSGSVVKGGSGETTAHEKISLGSCSSTPPTGAPSGVITNLALNKTAAQSSLAYGGVPGRAIDGNTNGTWQNGSVTHTRAGTTASPAWWEVDLGQISTIETIKLWNRTDCCTDRLSNVYLFVSNVPFANTTLTSSQSQSGVTEYYLPGQAGELTSVNVNRTGRYVRVQLSAPGVLSLAEVQVFGSSLSNSAVVAYDGTNYSGVSWSLTEGVYTFNDVRDSPIGNDKISSIKIAPGYAVQVCQHSSPTIGVCETYTSSMPQLGSLNNQASYLEVTTAGQSNSGGTVAPPRLEAENYVSMSGIRKVTGRDGNSTVVGYIKNGDSTTHKIDVISAGNVTVSARVASNTAGGDIKLILDGQQIGAITVPNTGDWNKFNTVSKQMTLPTAGNGQTLTLQFTGGGNGYLFDVNWLNFAPVAP